MSAHTDRELLELAAKAAGIDGGTIDFNESSGEWWIATRHGGSWRPFVDDGDALRLAVKLGAILGCFHGMGYSSVSIAFPDNDGEAYAQEYFHDHEGDRHAATRRAIVRAAAAIAATGEKGE